MSIATVIERGQFIYIYDEKGRQLGTIFNNSRHGDELKGYTPTTVNVRRGQMIYTYNEKGRQLHTAYAVSHET